MNSCWPLSLASIQMVVMVHKCGDEGDTFTLHRYQEGESPSLEVVVGYIIYKQRAKVVNGCNFILEKGGTAERAGQGRKIWGGDIATNAIVVEVGP